MCRIAGLINLSIPVTALEELVVEMCRVQKHGGPDNEGIYVNAKYNLVLGHRRLSIIDLSESGNQPMHYDNGRYVISYNGELYNYPELKEQLKKLGCCFNTASDTEVILAAFAKWGIAAFQKFNGMFAFALWDNVTGNIYLVRDGAGIKPLYFAHTKEGLAFASEVRAFKHIPYLKTEHPNWNVYLMAYGHLPEPITTLKNVQPLKKGYYLQYNILSGSIVQEQFIHFSYIERINDREQAITLIKDSLTTAVKRQLISDAPIGVFLSGGLDSSIIAHIANQHHPDLNTISLIFEDNNYSEKKYQDLVQKDFKSVQHQHLLKEETFHKDFSAIIKAMDMPSCDGINTWFISKYAKEHGLKAVLSGLGADELYGGYPSFYRMKSTLLAQKIPDVLLRTGKLSSLKKIRRLCYLSIDGPIGMYLFLRGQFIPREIAEYLNADEDEVWRILEEQPHLPSIKHLTAKNQAAWLETNLYMQNQLLRDADVMSMAHGVEIRVPFLDKDFLKLSLNISSNTKYNGEFKKQLLIDSFKDVLPEQVWNRSKMGFTLPFKQWLLNEQYAGNRPALPNTSYHDKFVGGKIHWSHFFTVFLMQNYLKA